MRRKNCLLSWDGRLACRPTKPQAGHPRLRRGGVREDQRLLAARALARPADASRGVAQFLLAVDAACSKRRFLGRRDTLGLPHWLEFASPVAAAVMVVVTVAVWRTGVRHYTSTGS